MSDVLARAAPALISYAERPDRDDTRFDRWGQRVAAPAAVALSRLRPGGARRFLRAVEAASAGLDAAGDDDLRAAAGRAAIALRRVQGLGSDAMAPLFAVLREAAHRSLGQRPYDVQLLGARAITRGELAEMRTGEGKTLTAAIAAAAAALTGWPVHVVTTSDYLAQRDARGLGPFYAFLGLSAGAIRHGQDGTARRAIYGSAIVYGSNKEIAFDYLRDRMRLRQVSGNLRRKLEHLMPPGGREPLRLRGLHFAIVDEADSVMIDDARTPLIIAAPVAEAADAVILRAAHDAAQTLQEGTDYRVEAGPGRVSLTDAGRDRLAAMAEDADGGFGVPVIREHAVTQALTARHLFERGVHYLLRDGKVCIIDENTGRMMPDRTWSDGLHQMVELKEDLTPSPPHDTQARITFQRFFRRYRRLAGMTGTAADAAWEFWSVYGLRVVRIPTNRPDRRHEGPDSVFSTADEKWQAIGAAVAGHHARGAPVLLGTRTVAESERASALLSDLGIPHQVLSAAQDADEAAKIAVAGQRGAVTVATSMAGRGVDIPLGPGVAALGGLHVILAERHDSRRVDRQLAGRCGRQGEPGSVATFLSLEDGLMQGQEAAFWRGLGRVFWSCSIIGGVVTCLRMRQRAVEARHAVARRDLLEADRSLQEVLAVSGGIE